MLNIILDLKNKDAICVPDGLVESYVEELINNYLESKKDKTIVFGNTLIVNYLRIAAKKGRIQRNQLVISSLTEDFVFHTNMKCIQTPKDFTDYWQESLFCLV